MTTHTHSHTYTETQTDRQTDSPVNANVSQEPLIRRNEKGIRQAQRSGSIGIREGPLLTHHRIRGLTHPPTQSKRQPEWTHCPTPHPVPQSPRPPPPRRPRRRRLRPCRRRPTNWPGTLGKNSRVRVRPKKIVENQATGRKSSLPSERKDPDLHGLSETLNKPPRFCSHKLRTRPLKRGLS